MTTTVTVTTHSWPVEVTTSSEHNYSANDARGWSQSHRAEFVPNRTTRTFNVTDTTSVSVRELPQDATSLDYLKLAAGDAAAVAALAAGDVFDLAPVAQD